MNYSEIILMMILLIHFLADFGLQTHDQAIQKGIGYSFYNKMLFYHVGVYSLIWLLATLPVFGIYSIVFAVITFITHYITDWITSRTSKKFFNVNNYHDGFVVVGFDQILHYLQLYFTFKYIITLL